MDSIAVLVYRIVEKEFMESRDAVIRDFVASMRDAAVPFDTRAFELVKSTITDTARQHSDQTTYRLHVALEGVLVLADPQYTGRKERLEKVLKDAEEIKDGRIDIQLEEEEIYSPEDYAERFSFE